MNISAPTDYRETARRRLPRFVFDYIDGGSMPSTRFAATSTTSAESRDGSQPGLDGWQL